MILLIDEVELFAKVKSEIKINIELGIIESQKTNNVQQVFL